jgi:DNA polymerase-1
MRTAVAARADGGGVLQPLAGDGTPAAPPETVPDLAAAMAEREKAGADGQAPRWVWSSTARRYPPLLAAGLRLARCHDLELVETLLLNYAGQYGQPRSARAAWARLTGAPVPADPAPHAPERQPSLFDQEAPADADEEIEVVVGVYRDQLARMAATEHADRLPVLAAAESAGGLVAAEMSHAGLPWRADIHDALFTEMLGPRPAHGMRPRLLQGLADRISQAFGHPVNPDSPAQLLKAFSVEGISIPSTRAHVLKRVDHPAVPLVLEYKELARLWTAHGWSWLDTWVTDGRFRTEYIVGGVVSGRWATDGGGALQIPKVLRRAVVADPGWKLVVADAAQLEPRVLAALAGDRAFADAAAQGDLYTALADAFGGARDKAKLALLSAMYGGGTGDAIQLLGVMRQRFPRAYELVESAARDGELGRLVRSRLGRTCPPPSPGWRELIARDSPEAASAMRSRGRFTRNFVVQATAAEWALILLATVRRALTAVPGAELVFFQHDEVIIHTPEAEAERVAALLPAAAEEAGRVLFGRTPVVFPLGAATVDCYADAK